MSRVLIPLVAILLAVANPAQTIAWNERGHKVVAYIAYRQLDAATRSKVIELFNLHPEFDDWQARADGGPQRDLNLFLFASVFADEVRDERHRWHAFNEPTSHYVNLPYIPRLEDRHNPAIRPVDPATVHNLLKAYRQKRSQVTDAKLSPRDRAVALSWIFHLVGDLHQPLHSVGRYMATFPEGDRGGNDVLVDNPRGVDKLHAYWDDLLGGKRQDAFVNVEQTAKELLSDSALQRERFPQLAATEFETWSQEGLRLAKSVVYQGLDPLDHTPELPANYEQTARETARRQVMLAGYRLADELKAMLGGS